MSGVTVVAVHTTIQDSVEGDDPVRQGDVGAGRAQEKKRKKNLNCL